jgi:putative NIF3 family GTP cyclohydrolase 1 type 2
MAIQIAGCNRIIGYLDDLLDPTADDDCKPNGLQVPGRGQIQTVVTGVSANADLFTHAHEHRADLRPSPRPDPPVRPHQAPL